jgi:adenylate cyclase
VAAPLSAACAQILRTAVACAAPDTGAIHFENARFFQWFPPPADPDASLFERLPGLDRERAEGRLARGRSFQWEVEIKEGAKSLTIDIELRREMLGGEDMLVAECQDVTKQKQAEYMLDSYSRLAEKNARELQREKERVEKLLLNVMPQTVYAELKEFGTTTPQRFDQASVLMLDFVGFTEMAVSREPSSLIGELNDIFSAFDRIAELFDCERIKTIGDAYMAVSGVPEQSADHAANIARLAVRMRRYLEKRNASHPIQWQCRIGVSSGPMIGSIVGIQKYVYDVFGPAPNLAARLEALAEPMQILIAETTRELIRTEFETSPRGGFELKGFGDVQVYSIEYEKTAR